MILSAQSIAWRCNQRRARPMIAPFPERTTTHGMTYGLGPAGYDVRIKQRVELQPGAFALASTVEHFDMPRDVIATVMDKSTWARRGLSLFNTVIEPGWSGWLTLELVNHLRDVIVIDAGSPIAQIVFQQLDMPTDCPYAGKYQDQANEPVAAILERVEG